VALVILGANLGWKGWTDYRKTQVTITR
jgi:hypothetical protein